MAYDPATVREDMMKGTSEAYKELEQSIIRQRLKDVQTLRSRATARTKKKRRPRETPVSLPRAPGFGSIKERMADAARNRMMRGVINRQF
jgi:hypothetical protein